MENQKNQAFVVKKSKGLYAMAIYGFVVLFVALLLPFIPFSVKFGSFVRYGFERMQNNLNFMNAFLPIAMIVNTVFALIFGIIFINRLRNFRAGVARSFLTFFKWNVAIVLTFVFAYLIIIKEDSLFKNYVVVYWYIVLGMYGGILIFALIAQLTTRILKPDGFKALFYWVGLVLLLVIILILILRSIELPTRYTYRDDLGRFASINRFASAIWEIDNIFLSILFIVTLFTIAHVFMPLNQPFQYMAYSNMNRDKKTKLSILPAIAFFVLGFGFMITYLVMHAKREVLCPILLMVLGVAKFVGATFYNKYVVEEKAPEAVVPEYNFFKKSEEEGEPTLKDKKRFCFTVGELSGINGRFNFKSKTTVESSSDSLMSAIRAKGINLDSQDVKKVLASVLSAKVTFIKGNVNEVSVTAFARALAEYFGEDLFIEHHQKEEEEEKPKASTFSNFSFSSFSSLSDISNTENASEQIEEKKEPTEEEKIAKEKYSLRSGVFVANALDNVLGLVFMDYSQAEKMELVDENIIDAMISHDEDLYVGRTEYLPETDYYRSSVAKNCENLRLIVFVSNNSKINLKPEWIKYSSVLDLDLTFNGQLISSERHKVETSFRMMNSMLEEAQSKYYLPEEYWRKMDILEEYLSSVAEIEFDNKFIRQLEQNIALFLASGLDNLQALDTVLCEKVLPLVSVYKEKILNAEVDFEAKIENLFGLSNIPLTQKAIETYGLKK